jgi:hypothetical protein
MGLVFSYQRMPCFEPVLSHTNTQILKLLKIEFPWWQIDIVLYPLEEPELRTVPKLAGKPTESKPEDTVVLKLFWPSRFGWE